MTSLRALAPLITAAIRRARHEREYREANKNPTAAGEIKDGMKTQILDDDQPGGERIDDVPAIPQVSDIEQLSRSSATRQNGERFALLLSHALEDETDGEGALDVLGRFGADTNSRVRDAIRSRGVVPGSRVVAGSRSWLRSRVLDNDAMSMIVRVIEKVDVPAFGSPGDPFIFWVDNTFEIEHRAGRWMLVGLDSAAASDSERFSPATWRLIMDSGRGWRRVPVR